MHERNVKIVIRERGDNFCVCVSQNTPIERKLKMSQTKSCRGVSRVLAKLEESVQCGKYYEAHQKYRTLYFRYLSQKRFDECLELLFSGAQILLDNQQYSSGADLGLLVVDTLEKSNVADTELWINRLGTIIAKISPNLVERETLLVSVASAT